jgi:hypothetical protein
MQKDSFLKRNAGQRRWRLALALAAVLASCTANDDIHQPAIGGLTPDRGPPGTAVRIEGEYFCAQPEPDDPDDVDPLACANTGAVWFGDVPANVNLYTETTILAEVPDVTPGAVIVSVTVAGRRSNHAVFNLE